MKRHWYIIACLSLLGCSNEKRTCYKELIVNGKFKDVSGLTKDESEKFIFTDSNQITYVKDKLYAEATVIWRSCSQYDLILRNVYYEHGLKVGDTVSVDIQSLKVDTFYYVAAAYGQKVSGKFSRTK